MSQGVPGSPPPKFLQEALGASASSPQSFGYCPADGEPLLRKALEEEIKSIYGSDSDVTVNDIALTTGCNLAFFATIMSLADAGDEVILPVPWYTALDCLQICPPRPFQIALAPLLPRMRLFIRETAEAIHVRHQLFRQVLPPRWKIGAQGGYFAFVRHPFKGVASLDVCKRLATELGVVTLPSAFFCKAYELTGQATWDKSRWVRFSVANVNNDKVKEICKRLAESELVFGWELD
ncbi:hypothetical protein C0992_009796 [Termitomyces sp. T32_za158]|nr:hypothetical protein C0992_009796 [Termitomyces sp. T32_za158]